MRNAKQGNDLKISNTARNYNKDENLENYDGEAQMYTWAHTEPRFAN